MISAHHLKQYRFIFSVLLSPSALGRTVVRKPYSITATQSGFWDLLWDLLIQHVLACATGLLLSPVRNTVEKWE